MELMITEFLIQLPFILSNLNELKLSIESSKGIYSILSLSFSDLSSFTLSLVIIVFFAIVVPFLLIIVFFILFFRVFIMFQLFQLF